MSVGGVRTLRRVVFETAARTSESGIVPSKLCVVHDIVIDRRPIGRLSVLGDKTMFDDDKSNGYHTVGLLAWHSPAAAPAAAAVPHTCARWECRSGNRKKIKKTVNIARSSRIELRLRYFAVALNIRVRRQCLLLIRNRSLFIIDLHGSEAAAVKNTESSPSARHSFRTACASQGSPKYRHISRRCGR